MPNTPYVPPAYNYSDGDRLSIIEESLTRAILIRRDILAKPKPSYDIDGQKFSWNEYLTVLNKTIEQLQKDKQDFNELYEIDSSLYT